MESDHATHVSSTDLLAAPLANQLSKFMSRDYVSLQIFNQMNTRIKPTNQNLKFSGTPLYIWSRMVQKSFISLSYGRSNCLNPLPPEFFFRRFSGHSLR